MGGGRWGWLVDDSLQGEKKKRKKEKRGTLFIYCHLASMYTHINKLIHIHVETLVRDQRVSPL